MDAQSKKRATIALKDEADLRVMSFPKCGRTWLAFMATSYIADALDIPAPGWDSGGEVLHSLLPERDPAFVSAVRMARRQGHGAARLIQFRHPGQMTIPYFVPEPINARGRQSALLLRHPGDVVVSYFHHIMDYGKGRVSGTNRTWSLDPETTLEEFIYSDLFGLRKIVAFMTGAARWAAEKNVPIIYFEDLRRSPETELGRLLEAAGISPEADRLARAVSDNSFDRLRRGEQRGFPRRSPDRQRFRVGSSGRFQELVDDRGRALADRLIRRSGAEALSRYAP